MSPTAGTEPLGRRIIEVPENLEQFERRDGRSRWIAYVPLGSSTRPEEMKPIVESLSMDDMISLAAYAASLDP